MRFAIVALCLSVLAPAVATAAIPRSDARASVVKEQVQLADYYRGNKHCRTVGSATVCN